MARSPEGAVDDSRNSDTPTWRPDGGPEAIRAGFDYSPAAIARFRAHRVSGGHQKWPDQTDTDREERREAIEGLSAVQAPSAHHDTINQAELYDGLAVQTGYENLHSQYWYDQQAQVEKSFA